MTNGLVVGGLPEREFLKEIQLLLRVGRAEEAEGRLKALLFGLDGLDRLLPARFLTVSAANVELLGWNEVPARIQEYDKRGKNITAIGIDFSDPSHRNQHPDAHGLLDPCIETNFYTDDAWPFSTSDRLRLLEGYTEYGCKWAGEFEEIDDTIAVKGLGDLYGAIFTSGEEWAKLALEKKQANVLGACYVAVLVHLAVKNYANRSVLPRSMAVMVGSNEDYPFFDAPAFVAV